MGLFNRKKYIENPQPDGLIAFDPKDPMNRYKVHLGMGLWDFSFTAALHLEVSAPGNNSDENDIIGFYITPIRDSPLIELSEQEGRILARELLRAIWMNFSTLAERNKDNKYDLVHKIVREAYGKEAIESYGEETQEAGELLVSLYPFIREIEQHPKGIECLKKYLESDKQK